MRLDKKEDWTAATACMIPKENANRSGAVAIRTKYAGVPLYPKHENNNKTQKGTIGST